RAAPPAPLPRSPPPAPTPAPRRRTVHDRSEIRPRPFRPFSSPAANLAAERAWEHPFVARLLIVHHTPSPATAEPLDAVVRGASDPEIAGVDVVRRAALAATAGDLLAADAVVLGTPANIGYMSGALKHFFDTVYYVCADDTR